MHESIWSKTAALPSFESQKEDIKTDVLIIGGGFSGILCAYFLQQRRVDYALIEANTICSGVTQNTTAKITSLHGLMYADLIKQYGVEKAKMYFEANQKALYTYEALCQNIECDFVPQDAFTYSVQDRKKIEDEVLALGRLGADAEFVQNLPLPYETKGAVRLLHQAQFHPLKFVKGLLSGLNIYEHTKAEEFVPGGVITNRGKISAQKIIVCTHFPILNKHGGYFLKLYQHRSYVMAFQNAPAFSGMYVDESDTGFSFRGFKDLLLIGGGGHRTGKQGGAWRDIEKLANTHYPNSKLFAKWATQDCMSLDHIPYIGPYGKHAQNLYVATGFNKWGMTGSMVSAMILSDMVQGKKSDEAAVFSPARPMFTKQLFVNGLESTVNLLTPAKKRCPHLGCALKWNKEEHSWDCPCHGSRFDEEGTLLNNPANDDIFIKNPK